MRVVRVDILGRFMRKHAQARAPLQSWLSEARKARWRKWADVKKRYPRADLIRSVSGGHRVVFDIKGNDYRLAVLVYFGHDTVVIEKVGTHDEYDKWKL